MMLKLDGIDPPNIENTHANRIRVLKKEGLIPKNIDDILYALRVTRNDAIHQNFEDVEKCKTLIEMAHTLSVWFMQTYGEWNFNSVSFVLPSEENDDYHSIIKEKEQLIQELTHKIESIPAQSVSGNARRQQANKAAAFINLSERETRYIIDEQLRQVGWEADTDNLKYSKGTRPQKGKNIAIAEWPTDSKISSRGYADYALFVGEKIVAIIEAKKAIVDIPSILDVQAKDYAQCVKEEHTPYIVSKWHVYQVPFIFATNGRKYLEQYKEKSGIWLLDLRDESNIAKPLRGWVSPQGILEWLEKDIEAANNNLKNTSKDLLTDKEGLNLRDYQVEAIGSVEDAMDRLH